MFPKARKGLYMKELSRTRKKIRQLASSTVTEVANYDFRSIEEIKDFTKELEKEVVSLDKRFNQVKKVLAASVEIAIKMRVLHTGTSGGKFRNVTQPVKIVPPNKKKLEENFSIIEEYQEKLESLDTVLNTLSIQFKGERGVSQALTNVKQLKQKVQKKLDAAYKFLSELAKRHQPQVFRDMINYVADQVLNVYEGSYKSLKQVSYLSPVKKDLILLTHYIELTDFQADDYVSPKYYIIIAAEVNAKNGDTRYSVNTSQRFAAPGKTKGINVKDQKDAAEQILLLLDYDGFTNLIDRMPIPKTQKQIDKINWSVPKEWIKKTTLDDSVITVQFTNKVNKSNINQALDKFVEDIKILIAPNMRMTVQKRSYQRGRTFYADFVLILPDSTQRRQIRLDGRRMKVLRELLDLTDQEAVNLIKHLNE